MTTPGSFLPRASVIANVKGTWGTAAVLEVLAPSRIADERLRAWYARSERFVHGPDLLADMVRASFEDDVRPLLPAISVPTVVLHREGDRFIRPGAGRYLAEHIPRAKFVVLPGDDHLFFGGDRRLDGRDRRVLDRCPQGERGRCPNHDRPLHRRRGVDRAPSTGGPREWSRLTDHHDAMVRGALSRHRGREVKTIGDAFLTTFDATGKELRCAAEILAGAKDLGLDLRVGL